MTDPIPPAEVTVENIETANVAAHPVANDPWTVRIVIVAISVIVGAIVVGSIVLRLRYATRTLPIEILTLGATLGGALAGILATTATRSKD